MTFTSLTVALTDALFVNPFNLPIDEVPAFGHAIHMASFAVGFHCPRTLFKTSSRTVYRVSTVLAMSSKAFLLKMNNFICSSLRSSQASLRTLCKTSLLWQPVLQDPSRNLTAGPCCVREEVILAFANSSLCSSQKLAWSTLSQTHA
jgi:hypothetical protein